MQIAILRGRSRSPALTRSPIELYTHYTAWNYMHDHASGSERDTRRLCTAIRPAAMTQLNLELETILNEAERRALVAVLRSRPDLTLDKLQDCFTGRYG